MEEGGDQKQCEPKATLGGVPFWLGVILMALSFGIYPASPAVRFLSISAWRKREVAMGLSAELGDVLSGVGADRQEGRGLP